VRISNRKKDKLDLFFHNGGIWKYDFERIREEQPVMDEHVERKPSIYLPGLSLIFFYQLQTVYMAQKTASIVH
jgi:hypothetical protein